MVGEKSSKRILVKAALVALAAMTAQRAHAVNTDTWTGLAGDNLWTTGGNWQSLAQPSGTSTPPGTDAILASYSDATAYLINYDSTTFADPTKTIFDSLTEANTGGGSVTFNLNGGTFATTNSVSLGVHSTFNVQPGTTFNPGALTLSGGTLNVQAAAAGSSASYPALALGIGDSTSKSTYGTSGNASLTFAGVSRVSGSTLNLVSSGGANGTTNNIVLTGQATGFINSSTFFNGSNFAWYDAGGFVRGINYGTDSNSFSIGTSAAAGAVPSTTQYLKVTGALSAQTATITLNTLVLDASAAASGNNPVSWNIGTAVVSTNGIDKTGGVGAGSTGLMQINGGSFKIATANSDLVVRTDTATDSLLISATITANGTNNLVKSGAGDFLISSSSNTFTGDTIIDGGRLIIDNGLTLKTSTVNYNNFGGTLAFEGVNGTGTAAIPGANIGGLKGSQNLNLITTANASVALMIGSSSDSQSTTYSGAISDISGATSLSVGGSLIKAGTGTLTITNPNSSYTGATTVLSGILSIPSLSASSAPSVLGASGPAATNLLLNGGTLQFNGTSAATTDHLFAIGTGSGTIDASGAPGASLSFTNPGSAVSNDSASRLGTTAANKVITGIPSTADLSVGMTVSGTGVASGATIASIDSPTQITIAASANDTVSTNTTLTFNTGLARTLTLTGTNTDANTIAPSLSDSATGKLSLVKNGAGSWTLSGSDNYSGSTTVNTGTLQLTGSGLLGSATTGTALTVGVGATFNVTGGAATLNLASLMANANSTVTLGGGATNFLGATPFITVNQTMLTFGTPITSANPVAVNSNGGALNFKSAATGSTSSLGMLTVTGDNTVQSTYGSSGNAVLNFTGVTRLAGATLNFVTSGGVNGSTNNIVLAGQPSGFISPGVFFNGGNFAWYNTTVAPGFVRGIIYGSDAGAVTTAGTTSISGTYVQTTGPVSAEATNTFTTLALSGANTFNLASGATLTVSGIDKSGTGSGSITGGTGIQAGTNSDLVIRTDAATDSLNVASSILANGTNILTKTGAGTLTLSGANTYTGGTLILSGTLAAGSSTALPSTGGVTLVTGGALNLNGQAVTAGGLNLTGGTIVDSVGGGSLKLNGDVSAISGIPATISVPLSLTGTSNVRTFNVVGTSASDLTLSGVISKGDQSNVTLLKTGTGTMTLSGANSGSSFSTLEVAGGGTLRIDGSTGALVDSAVGLTLGGTGTSAGTFKFDNTTSTGSQSNLMGPLLAASGDGTVNSVRTAPQNVTTSFTTFTRSPGATANFVVTGGTNGTTNKISLSGQPTGFVDPGAFFNGTDFAYNDAGGFLRAINYTAGTGDSAAQLVASAAAGINPASGNGGSTSYLKVTGTDASQGNFLLNLQSLVMSGTATMTNVVNSANVHTINAIIKSGGGTGSITNAGKYMPTSNGDFIIRTDTASDILTISWQMVANGTNNLVKSGAGTLTLGNDMLYTGDTDVNGGTLILNSANAIAKSTLNYNNLGGVVSFGTETAAPIGGLKGIQNLALANATNGAVALTVGGNNASTSYSGVLSGGGSLIKTGTGTLTLSGADTYLGATTLNVGVLAITSDAAVNNGTAAINFAGGTLQFNNYSSNLAFNGISVLSLGAATGTPSTLAGAVAGGSNLTYVGPGTLTLSSAGTTYSGNTHVTAGTLNLGSATNVASGNVTVDASATLGVSGILTGTPTVTDNGTINVAASDGTNNPSSSIIARNWNSLTVGATASVNFAPATSRATHTVLVTTLTNTAGGKVDLSSNDLILHNADQSGVATAGSIANQIATGFNSGAGYWNGASGITSSAAAGDTRFLTALGYMPGGSTFDGQSTSSSDVLVKYTYYGDANLDGLVNGADYQQIDMGFGTGATGWSNGDFNYDGVINGSDFALIDNTFNQITASGASALAITATPASLLAGPAVSAVPEPTTLGLLGIGAAGLLGRRRRRNA